MALRIAYLTDSHLGADGRGYHQQACWVGGLKTIMRRLGDLLCEHEVDLVIHGGDMVDDARTELIGPALDQLAALGRPVLGCLGNHDVCAPDAMALWTNEVGRHAGITLADAHREFDECDVYVLNNYWDDGRGPVLYWDPAPPYRYQPCVTDEQLAWLDSHLAKRHDRLAIIAVHTQLDRVPASDPRLHDYIPRAYPAALNELFDRHRHVRLVLSGHCHVTALADHGQRVHLTTAATCEIPFHVRLIEIHDRGINVETHELGPAPDDVRFIEENAWAVGTEKDQHFVLPICGC